MTDTIDISKLSDEELKELNEISTQTLQARQEEARADAITMIKQMVEAHSISYDMVKDMFSTKKNASKGRKRTMPHADAAPHTHPMYRDPESGQTWTGRGRRPNWLKEQLKTHDLESMKIEDNTTQAGATH